MIGWFVENSLGLFPPILERRLKRTEIGKRTPAPSAKECSVSYMLSIVPRTGTPSPATLIVKGYQWNGGVRAKINFSTALDAEDCYVVRDVRKTRMTTFSCHDKTVLYMFIVDASGKTCMYYTQFRGCHSLRDPKTPLYRVELFHKDGFYKIDEEPSHDLTLKSIDIRSRHQGLLHCYWGIQDAEVKQSKHPVNLEVEGEKYRIHGFCCIFCIREFESIGSLTSHINRMHFSYKCIQNGETLLFRKEEAGSLQAGKTLIYFSKRYTRKRLGVRAVPTVGQEHESPVNGIWSIENLSNLINRDIRTNPGLSEHSLALMERWNVLRLHGNALGDDIVRFARQEKNNPSIVHFLLVLYHKSIVNPKEFIELIYSLLEEA
ncbi:ZINC FINGER PROTEIN [Encephalitozoon cuniculi GB-M1]|uniref:ZINC FINGER PROTEIN n=2 Tax=Encephalitozoon cuniculi TaxID=6035 RepID=Q8SSJ8_ENCCU|nr:uncharacterized protein ECU01_1190 [Encephalitozoon cuniculi GB-M1]AGE96043.1 zinc finger protein [Encephalitozoon cuniculi]KMV66775.1 hypothetical protein M970_011050 [Encephalitozoon cuniculi EcunIII-L]UYI28493.1 hypothetical protein J0A71_11g24070 [Encephalitozoon cuniculi]CAD24992.1 ZINC FINGER PROTEIN [Encephalitozoon cuniculi GB-M1]